MQKLHTSSVASGLRISPDIKVDYITAKHIGFTSIDKRYDTSYSVIYFSEKEFPGSWNCACKFGSIGKGFCKHVLAVFHRLNNDESFLKKLPKEKLN